MVADRSFGGWIQFEESMALKEAGLSVDICVQLDKSNAAYPIHQLDNILSIESMIDELYETVSLKAAK